MSQFFCFSRVIIRVLFCGLLLSSYRYYQCKPLKCCMIKCLLPNIHTFVQNIYNADKHMVLCMKTTLKIKVKKYLFSKYKHFISIKSAL